MFPHLSIIKFCLKKPQFQFVSKYLDASDFPEELQNIYRAVEGFHKTSDGDISVLDLAGLLYTPNPAKMEVINTSLDTLEKVVPNEELTLDLINKIKRTKVLRELSLAAYEAAEGRKTYESVQEVLSQLDKPDVEEEEDDFVEEGLSDLIEQTYKQPGLRWRMDCLNKSLGSLRQGDFGFVFARPETGKTTFLASEVSFMAEQTDRPVIWFNNEEGGKKVKIRVYQGSLGVELDQLAVDPDGKEKEYLARTGNRIKIVDRKAITKTFVENILKKYKPALVLFDQIDKIIGFKADREDLMLGAIYQWARELAKQYCPIIGICQSDGTGENVRDLTMSHVANSKTAKQAEADWILGIGCIHDTGWEEIRFLNISKNKLQGDIDTDPKLRHGRFEVLIQPSIARYKDM